MASAAAPVISTPKLSEMEKIIEFVPERLKAPFFLRCSALFVDYMILLALPIGWLVLSRMLSETGTPVIGPTIWVLGFLLFFLNFLVLPVFRGQTIGKMLTGLTILNTDGTHLTLGGVVRRNILGYAATVLTGGLGFLISAINASGRALHDFTAGTIVVRASKTQV